VKSGEALCARSIEPFEGGRWQLRWMRVNGWTGRTAMVIESFFVLQPIDFAGLRKIGGKRKSQLKGLPGGMT
jgi:hypothetical protein